MAVFGTMAALRFLIPAARRLRERRRAANTLSFLTFSPLSGLRQPADGGASGTTLSDVTISQPVVQIDAAAEEAAAVASFEGAVAAAAERAAAARGQRAEDEARRRVAEETRRRLAEESRRELLETEAALEAVAAMEAAENSHFDGLFATEDSATMTPSSPTPIQPPTACSVCLDEMPLSALMLIVPCGHRCVCASCAASIAGLAMVAARRCPICRGQLTLAIRVHDV